MSLKLLKRIRRTVALRLTVWYSSIFILSSFLLFFIAYFALSSSLAGQDHESVRIKLEELLNLFEASGLEGLRKESGSVKKFEKSPSFFIRLAGADGATLFLSIPSQWSEFDLSRLDEPGLKTGAVGRIERLPSRYNKSFLEVATRSAPGGYALQIGKSTEERDAVLSHFRGVFAAVMVPLILVGFMGGAFLGYRALSPVRSLVATIRSIGAGRMDARVPVPQTGDELEELARLFNAMVEKIDALVTAMRQSLDNVAHDLRTPMTRFRGMAELALEGDEEPERCRDVLADCVEESDRILTMLNTLLDISEAETGVMKLDIREIKVSELIERVVDLYGYVAEEKGIKMSVSCPADLVASADDSRMARVLANLVDNAIKYTPSGGSVSIEGQGDNEEVKIFVRDNGTGIEQAELPRIWDRLYRGDRSRSEKGLGLGLSLVKAVMEAHGGRVEAASLPGEGSILTVTLPNPRPVTK